MGLVISRSIAEAYGGSLWMTKNAERGVTFHLALPPRQRRKAVTSALSVAWYLLSMMTRACVR